MYERDKHNMHHSFGQKFKTQTVYLRIGYKMNRDIIPLITGLSVGIAFIVLFSVLANVSFGNRQPAVSTVVFIKDASFPDAPNNGIEPKVIGVIIGVNNTVRWENHDAIPHGFPIPDDESIDPDFAKFITMKYDENGFLLPKQSFEYTFTVPGRIDYHMVPHPQMRGAVIVMHALPTS